MNKKLRFAWFLPALIVLVSLFPFWAGCTTNPEDCRSQCPARALVTYNLILQNLTKSCTTDSCVRSADLSATMQMLVGFLGCESGCTSKETKKNPFNLPF